MKNYIIRFMYRENGNLQTVVRECEYLSKTRAIADCKRYAELNGWRLLDVQVAV